MTATRALRKFRAGHGDPATWSAAEYEQYLDLCATHATTAAAMAAADDELLFDTETGQAALRDIIETLTREEQNLVDGEDLAHYSALLAAPVTRLTTRTTESTARGWAA